MIRTKKDALADAYANNGDVPARLGPVGSSAYTPQGTAHDWLYTSLEDAGRGGRTCKMDIGGRALRLRGMNWASRSGHASGGLRGGRTSSAAIRQASI